MLQEKGFMYETFVIEIRRDNLKTTLILRYNKIMKNSK